MFSSRKYFGIWHYFKKTFPKHLLFCVGHILSTFVTRIISQILQSHLRQGRPPSLPPNDVPKLTNVSTQLPIYSVAGGHMIQYRVS